MKTLKVFEAFAGYGSQSIALENLGINHEVVGIAEVDADAIISHAAIRGFDLDVDNDNFDDIVQNMLDSNVAYDFKNGKSKLPRMNKKKKKQLANANVAVKNFGDISLLDPSELPDFDLFTYSFPCQDLSTAGKKQGLGEGTRSGLLYECEKVIETKRPKYLLLENVKNLVGKQFKNDFDTWLSYLESLGYTNYWQVLNAKDYDVPQNRERVFVVSILGDHDTYHFPEKVELTKRIRDVLDDTVADKYYLDRPFTLTNTATTETDTIVKGASIGSSYNSRDIVYNTSGVAGTLCARDFKDPHQILEPFTIADDTQTGFNGICYYTDTVPTLRAGRSGLKVVTDEILLETALTVQAIAKQTRKKDDIRISISDDGNIRPYKNDSKKSGLSELNVTHPGNVANTITTSHAPKIYLPNELVGIGHHPFSKKYEFNGYHDKESPCLLATDYKAPKTVAYTTDNPVHYRIRKLTPLECWRLMGMSDEHFKLAEKYVSNSQLYKQAGNSIVVDVLEAIFEPLLRDYK